MVHLFKKFKKKIVKHIFWCPRLFTSNEMTKIYPTYTPFLTYCNPQERDKTNSCYLNSNSNPNEIY